MVTVMLFGNSKECENAIKMIDEAMENREQKQKQREKEYEKKRDAKNRDRQMYHLRHTNDYETLGIPIGKAIQSARLTYESSAKVKSRQCQSYLPAIYNIYSLATPD